MTGRLFPTLALLALLVPALCQDSQAASRNAVNCTLAELLKAPDGYAGKEVVFRCRFAEVGELYKAANTRFTSSDHVNFSAWTETAEVWTEEGRQQTILSLYVARRGRGLLKVLEKLEPYDLVVVTGRVASVYSGTPWILVSRIEPQEGPDARIDPEAVANMRLGLEALAAEDGATANRHFEKALAADLPPSHVAAAYEYSARASLLTGDYAAARERLETALAGGRNEPTLRLALADICLKLGRADEALGHAHAAMRQRDLRIPGLGCAAEARAMRGDLVSAFNDLNLASSTEGITPRESALLDVHRARIYKRAGRPGDAVVLYAELTGSGSALADEPWLNAESGAFHEALYLAGNGIAHLDIAYADFERGLEPGRAGIASLQKMAEIEMRRQKVVVNPNLARAEELVGRMHALMPDHPPTRILEARLLCAKGDTVGAAKICALYEGKVRDHDSLTALAEAYADLGDYERADRYLAEAGQRSRDERSLALGMHMAMASGRGAPAPRIPDGVERMAEQSSVAVAAAPAIAAPVEFGPPARTGSPNAFASMAGSNEMVGLDRERAGAAMPSGDMLAALPVPVEPMQLMAAPAPAADNGRLDLPVSEVRLGTAGAAERHVLTLDVDASVSGTASFMPAYYEVGPEVARVELPAKPEPEAPALFDAPPAAPAMAEPAAPPAPVQEAGQPPAAQPLRVKPVRMDDGFVPATRPALFMVEDDARPLLAGYGAELDSAPDMPVRNANLYRKNRGNGRRPAEIIEKEPLRPSRPQISAMTPSADGQPHKTRVLLPGSPQGIGLDHELAPLQ